MPEPTVDDYLAQLEHPMKPTIVRLRAAILASNPALTEHVKWNAPSFVWDGEDRITFNLRPDNKIRIVLHRGVKVRADSAGFVFLDGTGLVTWAAPDRGVITFASGEDAGQREAELLDLVGRWLRV